MTGTTVQSQRDPESCRIISWNVNGLRQRHQMNQVLPVFGHDPDIVCIQEAKTPVGKIPRELKNLHGYSCFWNDTHPGKTTDVMLFSKQEPDQILTGFGNSSFDTEGRVLVATYETFTLMNVYFPLGIGPVDSVEHKLAFYDAFISFVSRLNNEGQNLIICGDFSIAHTDDDIEKPVRRDTRRTGVTREERGKLDQLVVAGFSDAFRLFNGGRGHYSWWPNGFSAGERRFGWRLDYFFVNPLIRPHVTHTEILTCHEGSDHCPVMMTMTMPQRASHWKLPQIDPAERKKAGSLS